MMEIIASTKLHGGTHQVIRHDSTACHCPMEFAVFIPSGEGVFPCVYFLSGLTCTWENAATKAGAQYWASQRGLVLVFPDTSPRGDGVADDEAFSLGQGAGFYMDATVAPWARNYAMDSYITDELPRLVGDIAPVDPSRIGITGHSMGGHGALTLGMKNPGLYRALSAFAPISSLTQLPWGKAALAAYRGDTPLTFPLYDAAACLQSHGWAGDILIDQGADDPYIKEHLRPDLLTDAAQKAGVDLTLRMQAGYDHSYWFVASFMEDHINWHASRLR